MEKFKTINDLEVVQCGDYIWRVLKENDGTDIFEITISINEEQKSKGYSDITLYYDTRHKMFSVRNFQSTYLGGDFFCFKLQFKETPLLVKALLEGHNGYLMPLYHKDSVKLKNNTYE